MARIADTTVNEVKAAADMVELVSARTALRKVGGRYTGRCPFHEERTPSFSVNAADKLYYCFGCGARGDVITFVRETEQLDFNEAVEWLAERFGVKIEREASSPAAERERCAIFGNEYGQAGAIDFYGPALGLPKAISGHLTYWYWGPRGYSGDVMIVLGGRRKVLEREFEDVRAVAEIGQEYAMAQEHFTLFVCRKPKGWTLASAWPRLKSWD